MTTSDDSTTSGAMPPIGVLRPSTTAMMVDSRAGMSAKVATKFLANCSAGVRFIAGRGQRQDRQQSKPCRGVLAGRAGQAQLLEHRRQTVGRAFQPQEMQE